MTFPQRIAIIGTGISGIGAGLALSHAGHEVVFYEKDRRPGGHSATVDIVHEGEEISVDTGFIVYNELNYPNLTAMFDWLQVETMVGALNGAGVMVRMLSEACLHSAAISSHPAISGC